VEHLGEIFLAKKAMTTRRRERTKLASLAMVSGVFMLYSVLVLVLLCPCRTDVSREAAALVKEKLQRAMLFAYGTF
jgi:hypothetical protein